MEEQQINFKKNLQDNRQQIQEQQLLKKDDRNQDLPLQQSQMEVQQGLGGTGCSPEKIQSMTKAAEDFYSNEKNQNKFTFASPQSLQQTNSQKLQNNTNLQQNLQYNNIEGISNDNYQSYQQKYQQEVNFERQERLRKKQQIQEEINQLRRRMEDLEMSISKKQQHREIIQSPASNYNLNQNQNYSANKYSKLYQNTAGSITSNENRGFSGNAEKQFKENLYDQKVHQFSDNYYTNMQRYESNINFSDVRKQQIQREQELQESIKKRKQLLLTLNQNQQQINNSLYNQQVVSPSQEKFKIKMKQQQQLQQQNTSQITSSATEGGNIRANMSNYSKTNVQSQQQLYNAADKQYYSPSTKYVDYIDNKFNRGESSVERLQNAIYQDFATQQTSNDLRPKTSEILTGKQQKLQQNSQQQQSSSENVNSGVEGQQKKPKSKKKKNQKTNIYEKYKQERDQQRQSMDQRILEQTINNKIFSPEKVKDDFEMNKFYFNNKYNSDQVYQNYQKEQELKNLVQKVKTSVKKQMQGQKSETQFQKFKVQKIYKHNCVRQNTGKNLPFKIRGPKDQIEIKYFGSPRPCQQCMMLLVQGLPTSLCQSHGNPNDVIMPSNQIPNRFEKQIKKKKQK